MREDIFWSIETLRSALDQVGIPRDEYCLPPECLALRWMLYQNDATQWQIYFNEKGMQDLEVFQSESDACKRFFEIMTGKKAVP